MGILVYDGQTREAVIPANPTVFDEFTIKYRPLASYEYEQYRVASGPAQIELVTAKLVSWSLIMDEEAALYIGQNITKRREQAGQPMPIMPEVLRLIDGSAFERIYMGIMGLLLTPKGKTGIEATRESVKN